MIEFVNVLMDGMAKYAIPWFVEMSKNVIIMVFLYSQKIGKCYVDNGKRNCNCSVGWKGEDCEIARCGGIYNCNNHGIFIH